jgi:predicted LPLAT superfamily acyltransferase
MENSVTRTVIEPGAKAEARNPGPGWGYQFLRITDKIVPEVIFRPLRAIGTAIAVAGMPAQRRCSRVYLREILGREPSWVEVCRHFFAFEEALMLRLRVANGRPYPCQFAPEADAFRDWYINGGPALLGTFHIGVSDLLGFQLGGMNKGRIYLVRQRVGNSHDTERLSARFGQGLQFIWINQPSEMLFALKEAARSNDAIALQCDRIDYSSKTEAFQFLGARRLFPFTIYHLAYIFSRPVILSVGLPGDGHSWLYSSPRFDPLPGEKREDGLVRAREHFQGFLTQLEKLLRADPYNWFNLLPLNPPVETAVAP